MLHPIESERDRRQNAKAVVLAFIVIAILGLAANELSELIGDWAYGIVTVAAMIAALRARAETLTDRTLRERGGPGIVAVRFVCYRLD